MKIAIDGTAASGKGTLAKGLAKKLGYDYLDTGLLYRRLALDIYKKGLTKFNLINERGIISNANINMLADITLKLTLPLSDHPDLRKQEISHLSAVIASIPEIREILFNREREKHVRTSQKCYSIFKRRKDARYVLFTYYYHQEHLLPSLYTIHLVSPCFSP